MPSHCTVSFCKKIKQTGEQNITFHKFPLNRPEVLKKWVQFVNKDNNWQPTKYSSICSKHFLQNDYSHGTRRKFLKVKAVPSNIIPSTQHSKASSIADSEDTEVLETMEEQYGDICGLCGMEDQMKCELKDQLFLIMKVLPNLKISSKNLNRKICNGCFSKLQLYDNFVDQVKEAQQESTVEVPSQPAEKIRIKQEPIQKQNSESEDETPLVLQKPSSKCEILEVVIPSSSIDLKQYDKMFQSVFLQCETLKSDIKITKTLKVEEISEDEESDNCLEPSLMKNSGININLFKDHCYNKLDIENSGLWLKKEEK